ncbi:carboxylesterase/lipase family protein [Streptomyces sp. NPDC102384]|uniref:carboxylesterase/lipase family protein n=1 Tax=Streptomyces sp. NPDC102384 TaxID=3366166 RepID=UPI00380DAF68
MKFSDTTPTRTPTRRSLIASALLAAAAGPVLATAGPASAATGRTARTVRTASGVLRGTPGTDTSITAFKGIPYAAAPVGDLRWKPPTPPTPWKGVRDADAFGASPPQAQAADGSLTMSEDCLFLNVWTGASSSRVDRRRPVFVWIYGGGFSGGTSSDPLFDGENLARKGVVVVTFNYRLGALGFLSTPELSAESPHGVSGNYGLLDQVAALKWVRRNIAAFGGDPANVTIGGQSAGAGSVGFLSMSPLATGLFRRSVAESQVRDPGDPELRYLGTSYRKAATAEEQGSAYASSHGAANLKELRALRWQDLNDAAALPDTTVDTGSVAKPPLFRPVVDGWLIPSDIDTTLTRGTQNDVMFLAGNNLDESGAVPETAFDYWRKAGYPDRPGAPPIHVTLDDFTDAARRKFGAMADEFLRLYPATTDDEAARASNDAVRDNARSSTHLWAKRWTHHTDRPVHTYFWTHRPPGPDHDIRGAYHASEIAYVFANPTTYWTDKDHEIADTMSSYWANYATTGNPNGRNLPNWPSYSANSPKVMEVGDHFGPVAVASPERLDFWRRFFATQQAW